MRRSTFVVLVAVVLAGCTSTSAGSPVASGPPRASADPALVSTSASTAVSTAVSGAPVPITLTFASAKPEDYDDVFTAAVEHLSGGAVTVVTKAYDDDSVDVDVTIAEDLRAGRLDLADVGSRTWESLGVRAFRGYQTPFLVTNQALLFRSVAAPVTAAPLASLNSIGVTGLTVVPIGERYLFSSRPLTTLQQFTGTAARVNTSPTTVAILAALGARADQTTRSGDPTRQALAARRLTAVEADMGTALGNDYVGTVPYVLSNAPLFAKTTTLAASTTSLAKLEPRVTTWLREAAVRAQQSRETGEPGGDQANWSMACDAGLKPQTLTPGQLAALTARLKGVTASIVSDPVARSLVARIRALAGKSSRVDSWATCR